MLLTFEGIDGCGKSTQIALLKGALLAKGFKVEVFREPGGTSVSEDIRSLLLDSKESIHPLPEMLLFSAARSQLISEKVLPLLSNDVIVILDRFYDSTIAYQGFGREIIDIEYIKFLNRIAAFGLIPDLTFYLKISYPESLKRTENIEKDRMEQAGAAFFERVIQGYDYLASSESRFVQVDATLEVHQIHQQIISKTLKHLG